MRNNTFLFTATTIFIFLFFLIILVLNTNSQEDANGNVSYSAQKKVTVSIDANSPPKKSIDIKATTIPQFIVNLVGEKFEHIWKVNASERNTMIEVSSVNIKGDTTLDLTKSFNEEKKQLEVIPKISNSVKPGLYNLQIKIKSVTDGDITITQDFTWGVMAVNTNKGKYTLGETVKLGMAVLGDLGNTKCIAHGKLQFSTAYVWLTITSPSGKIKKYSTLDNAISGSKECADRSVTNNPDFYTSTSADEEGTYKITMEAETVFGKRHIESSFQVISSSDFDVERSVFPTRIYPKADYPVSITIIPKKDYQGPVVDFVPKDFNIYAVSDLGSTSQKDSIQTIEWQVDWKKGETYTLSYTIHFPQIAPEFYVVGPIVIGNFSEGRAWKIASDSIFQFIQESHNTTSGTSVNTTLPDPIGQNHLVLKICYRTTNSSFSSQSGWTTAYNNSSGPRIYMFYRVAPASMSQTVTCSTTSSGVIAVQALEFSGNSTSSVRDQRTRLNGSTVCNTGAHNNINPNITPSNPDELVVSAFSATSTRTVSAHSTYTDTATSFNGSSGTFDSSWGEVINNPPVATSDTATYNGSGGTCDNLQVSFNPQITISQGGYRFFENQNDLIPGNPMDNTNTPVTLDVPKKAFRLRMLLDVDSPAGTTLALDSGDWILEYAELPTSGNCAEGVYNPVDTIANGTPIAFNPNVSSGGNNVFISATANDPSDGGYTTQLENYIETWLNDGSEDITNSQNTLGNNQAGLFDFSLIDNTDDTASKTYCFQLVNGDGSILDAYRNYPKVTTIHFDVIIRGGANIQGGTTIQ